MLLNLFTKLFEGFNFSIKDVIVLIIISIFLLGGYNVYNIVDNIDTNVNRMEMRYYSDIEENGFSVLVSLQNNNIVEPKDIITFLENKPAGRSDLKKALNNGQIYERLVNVFDGLAKNAKKALIY